MELNQGTDSLSVNTELSQSESSQLPVPSPSIESLDEYQSKPAHWYEDYWLLIKKRYKWLIHKNDYVGCAYCLSCAKEGAGRKSSLATMSLYLWNFEYQALEDKLTAHRQSTQHKQAMTLYRSRTRIKTPRGDVSNASKSQLELKCPICGKLYKIRKGFTNHMNYCKSENSIMANCCEVKNFHTIRDFDIHNLTIHCSRKKIKCHICEQYFDKMMDIFIHTMEAHESIWDPTSCHIDLEEPEGSKTSRKRGLNSAFQDYLVDDEVHNFLESCTTPSTTLETCTKNKISKIQIPNSYIATCLHCSGRYLSQAILNKHIEHYHSNEAQMKIQTDNKNNEQLLNQTIANLGIKIDRHAFEEDSKTNMFRCTLCTQVCTSISQKLRHVADMHPEFSHTTCTDCGVMCDGQNYQYHILECNAKRTKYSSNHLEETKSNASVLTCSLCNILCENIAQKINHVSKVHPEYEHTTCKECGLIFNSRNYAQHMLNCHDIQVSQRQKMLQKDQSSNNECQFSCTECPLVFTNHTDLINHCELSHKQVAASGTATKQESIEEATELQFQSETEDTAGNINEFEVIELGSKLDEDSKEDCANQDSINDSVKDSDQEPENITDEIKKEEIKAETVVDTAIELSELISSDPSSYLSSNEEAPVSCSACSKQVNNEFEMAVHKYIHEFSTTSSVSPLCHLCNRIWFGSDWQQRDKDHLYTFHKRAKDLYNCKTCQRCFDNFYLYNNHKCDAEEGDTIQDPYTPLMDDTRKAFMCEICLDIFAGEQAEERMKKHEEFCSL